MNDILEFLNKHYDNALKLCKDFEKTKQNNWEASDYVYELYVQVGHVYNVLNKNKIVNEFGRDINNLGDEISDVLLQLINLSYSLHIDLKEIQNIKYFKHSNLNSLVILLGQLTENLMECNSLRFRKERVGFDSSYEFIKDRIFKMLIITMNFAKKNNLNMIEEFDIMLNDATNFLNNFNASKYKNTEFIDIYNQDEDKIGYSEINKVHNIGFWHRTFGCVFVNTKKNKIYFQVKKPDEVNQRELLEITVGGHLEAGEELKDGTREIREESGYVVDFDSLIQIYKRKVNKRINDNFIIKEFQYYYLYNSNFLNLKSFKKYDTSEVLGFVELDIDDVVEILENNKMVTASVLIGTKISKRRIDVNSFDPAFVKDKLFITLIQKIKCHLEEIRKYDKVTFKDYIKVKKLQNYMKFEKLKKGDSFYYDNGEVCNNYDLTKGNIKYSVIQLKKDVAKKHYATYLLMIYKNKPIPYLLRKDFSNKNNSSKYFNVLCAFIDNNSNSIIINKCFSDID